MAADNHHIKVCSSVSRSYESKCSVKASSFGLGVVIAHKSPGYYAVSNKIMLMVQFTCFRGHLMEH